MLMLIAKEQKCGNFLLNFLLQAYKNAAPNNKPPFIQNSLLLLL